MIKYIFNGFIQCRNDQNCISFADVPPSIVSVFPEQTAHPRESISLKCQSTGNPVPRVAWFLDGSIVGRSARLTISDYATENGHVISYLNITDTRVEDGGSYKCEFSNDVGSVYHAARLNVYGPVFVRLMQNVTAISGEDLVVRCPYGGFPLKGIRWYKSKYIKMIMQLLVEIYNKNAAVFLILLYILQIRNFLKVKELIA